MVQVAMEINQNFDFVDGAFDTVDGELICVIKDKYNSVELCFKENMNIPFASIRLYSKETYQESKKVLDDAYNLGEEICRRWNECKDKR